MIYITGDTHGLKDIGKLFSFNLVNRLSEKDFMIIAGDFGIIWDPNLLRNILTYITASHLQPSLLMEIMKTSIFLTHFPSNNGMEGKSIKYRIKLFTLFAERSLALMRKKY